MNTKRLFLLLLILIFPQYVFSIEELPPGCSKQLGPGGCSGKSRIEFITVTPPLSCLHFSVNNCNGGTVTIQNECQFPWVMGQIKINVNASAPKNSIELYKDAKGIVKATYSNGNYASYHPTKNEVLLIEGKIGQEKVRLQYTKTKALCD